LYINLKKRKTKDTKNTLRPKTKPKREIHKFRRYDYRTEALTIKTEFKVPTGPEKS